MAFKYRWYNDYVIIEAGQHATGDEILATLEALSKDTRFSGTLDQIWDFSATEDFKLGSTDLARFNDIPKEQCFARDDSCLAFVASHPGIYFRLQAIVAFTRARGCNSKVFSDKDAALSWLNSFCIKGLV